MRRFPVFLNEEAIRDLDEIYRYVAEASGSPLTAIRFVRRIRRRCLRIGNVPFGGQARDDLKPGLRTVPFEHSAVIAYTVEERRVRIGNIFYGGRDYEALFRGEDEAGTGGDG